MDPVPFLKMHGLGNDFVVLDARQRRLAPTAGQVRALADRRTGVGFDQCIVVEPPRNGAADAFMRIRNADGGEVEACGNAARCVARLLMDEGGRDRVRIETVAGMLAAWAADDGLVAVDMGPAQTDWQAIPLAHACDPAHLDMAAGPLTDGCAVNMGNPHAVFFVADVASVDLESVGPELEHHPLFPNRANIEAAQATAADRLRLRVWERGVGVTRACGSGACAAAVAAHLRGLTGRTVTVDLDGGTLGIVWREDGHVELTGPAATSFTGRLDPAWLT